ncbi:MAG: [FeFe] hydrogenase H-cluster maturation GTPase HydF [Eubacteriales bacterium]|nr:[FeFe] hydrogenase H-cluster maturation GTPase HydF [Eubacteriales bacterium]
MTNLNQTPKGERIHIGIFGRTNAGKSSILNALINQNIAIVSEIKGTTTDPVSKAMELLPLGPVVIIDTPGLDDNSELGKDRIKKSYQMLAKTDIAIIAVDSSSGIGETETNLIDEIKSRSIPYITVFNKCDLAPVSVSGKNEIAVSALTGENITELKNMIATLAPEKEERVLVGDLIDSGDIIVLVVPIDEAAPKGRLILPQQQTIRDILDNGAIAVVCKDTELSDTLAKLSAKPRLVITDSQVFKKVAEIVPCDIPLTSFSILFARYKGDLQTLVDGAKAINSLEDGDRILIAEGCTHHRQCGDIGSVKIPRMLEKITGKKPVYDFVSGTEFAENTGEYKLIIHCGGCMLSEREMRTRIAATTARNIPIVNYGVLLACLTGILDRSLEPFSDITI